MNIDKIKYSLILMGQYLSLSNFELERELFYDAHQWNRQEPPNIWTSYPPKNIDYYEGKRFTKISRGYYPQFTKGYLWGRYEDLSYYDNMEIEREF